MLPCLKGPSKVTEGSLLFSWLGLQVDMGEGESSLEDEEWVGGLYIWKGAAWFFDLVAAAAKPILETACGLTWKVSPAVGVWGALSALMRDITLMQ